MPKQEIYQVYNEQNKQFVKMKNGQILGNSYFPFEGVPIFGDAPDRDQEPAGGPSQDGDQEAKKNGSTGRGYFTTLSEPGPNEDNNQDKKEDPADGVEDSDEDGGGFLDLF